MSSYHKNQQEHLETLEQLASLQLFFLHDFLSRSHERFQDAFRNRTDIYRKTHFNTGGLTQEPDYSNEAWLAFEKSLEDIYQNHLNDQTKFEAEAFRFIKESFKQRAPLDYQNEVNGLHLKNYQCGSLKVDPPRKDKPRHAFFHIANAIAPKSIFEDPSYLAKCLRSVHQHCIQEHQFDSICTSTWLNSHPLWVQQFPKSWITNMGPEDTDIIWHYGFWGQFFNAKGCFNKKLGEQFRRDKKLPFYPRRSECSLKELDQHLQSKGF